MQRSTIFAIKAILQADPSVSPADRTRIVNFLRKGGKEPQGKEQSAKPEQRIFRRAEAAHVLGGSVRLVDRLAAAGTLRRIKLPGRQRGQGFSAQDVFALMK